MLFCYYALFNEVNSIVEIEIQKKLQSFVNLSYRRSWARAVLLSAQTANIPKDVSSV